MLAGNVINVFVIVFVTGGGPLRALVRVTLKYCLKLLFGLSVCSDVIVGMTQKGN